MRRPAVLFVDDEPRILDGIRRSLRSRRHEWDLEFVTSGDAALEHLSRTPCDVVVSDMRMPGMDGAELLAQVCQWHPGVARVVLSGHTEQEAAVRASVVGHRFLNKPCDGDALAGLVEELSAGIQTPEAAQRRLAAGSVRCLPVPPEQMRRVAATLAGPDVELPRVIEAVVNSIGLAAKLLQLANSSFFGTRERVTSVTRAVTTLGLPTLQALVDTEPALWSAGPVDVAVWRHSVASARLVRELATPGNAPYSEVAALLQDVGRLAGADHADAEPADRAAADPRANHVGADLLHLWGLPRPIVVAVEERYVAREAYPFGLGVGGALRAAHLLLQDTGCADPYDRPHDGELAELLSHPQLVSHDRDWRSRAQQVAHEAVEALT